MHVHQSDYILGVNVMMVGAYKHIFLLRTNSHALFVTVWYTVGCHAAVFLYLVDPGVVSSADEGWCDITQEVLWVFGYV